MNTKAKSLLAFTLIEVLVVLGIISLLVSIVYINFGDARADAANKAFLSELKEMQLALELYRGQHGQYPTQPRTEAPGLPDCVDVTAGVLTTSNQGCVNNRYIEGLIPSYTSRLLSRTESVESGCDIEYQVDVVNGGWYKLTAVGCYGAESAAFGIEPDSTFARCPSEQCAADCAGSAMDGSFFNSAAFYKTPAVYSPGGECR